jgi:hypothetical protein
VPLFIVISMEEHAGREDGTHELSGRLDARGATFVPGLCLCSLN